MNDVTMKKRAIIQNWPGPRSECSVCGHTGDGEMSDHGGFHGHGGCTVDGCHCQHFRWKGYLPEVEKALKEVTS